MPPPQPAKKNWQKAPESLHSDMSHCTLRKFAQKSIKPHRSPCEAAHPMLD
jgi:hypothetical protein